MSFVYPAGLLALLALGGVVGGVAGTYLLTSVDGEKIKPFVVAWLGLMGLVILYRAWKGARPKPFSWKSPAPLGLVGGFFDAVGGGGWGPIVASTLLARGSEFRITVGSVNAVEFFVTLTASLTFILTIGLGYWPVIIGLALGGVVAAPFGAWLVKRVPVKPMMVLVGLLIIGLSLRTLGLHFGLI